MTIISHLDSYFGMSFDRVLRRKVVIEPKISVLCQNNRIKSTYNFPSGFSNKKIFLEIPLDFSLCIKIEKVRVVFQTVVFEFEPVGLLLNVMSQNTNVNSLESSFAKAKLNLASENVYLNYVVFNVKKQQTWLGRMLKKPKVGAIMRVSKNIDRNIIEWDIPVQLTASTILNVTQEVI
jgi:hypothetical protein